VFSGVTARNPAVDYLGKSRARRADKTQKQRESSKPAEIQHYSRGNS
jgi:hypothetical protein